MAGERNEMGSIRAMLGERRLRRLLAAVGFEYSAEALFIVLITLTALDSGAGGVAVVLMAQGIPRAVLLPVGGVVSDRVGPSRVAPLAACLRAALLLGLALAVVGGAQSVAVLAGVGAALGVLDGLSYPAGMALVPAACERDKLPQANAAIGGIEAIGDLVGPAAAAGLYALVGPGPALATVAALALASAAGFLLLRRSGVEGASGTEATPAAFLAGLRFAFGRPDIRPLLLALGAVSLLLIGPLLVGGALIADERFGDRAQLGLILAGFGLGSLAGMTVAPRLARRYRPSVPGVAGVGTALTMCAVALAPSLEVAVAASVAMGLIGGTVWVGFMTWIQERTPSAMQGRMMSIVAFAFVAMDPLSYALAGALLPLGATATLLLPAALLAAVSVAMLPWRERSA